MPILLLTISSFSYSQTNEAGGWAYLNIKKTFTDQWSIAFKSEYKCRDNFRITDEYLFRLSGGYKVCPYFDIDVAYDFCSKVKRGGEKDGLTLDRWTQRNHRALLDLKAGYRYGNWDFRLRERYVYSYAMTAEVTARDSLGMYVKAEQPGGSSHYLRTKPTISYDIPNTAFSPFVELELFNRLDQNFALQQLHLYVGTKIRINSVNSLKLFYVMQDKIQENAFIHTVGLEYIITL